MASPKEKNRYSRLTASSYVCSITSRDDRDDTSISSVLWGRWKLVININLRPVSSGLHFSCNACRLQRPYGGRAYRNDPASLCFRPVDSGSGFRGHAVKLSVHGMVFNIFFRNRTKRAQPYIQSDKHFFTAHVFDFLQKFFCKMQACSRRRSRPRIPVINCLIPFLVFQFFRKRQNG